MLQLLEAVQTTASSRCQPWVCWVQTLGINLGKGWQHCNLMTLQPDQFMWIHTEMSAIEMDCNPHFGGKGGHGGSMIAKLIAQLQFPIGCLLTLNIFTVSGICLLSSPTRHPSWGLYGKAMLTHLPTQWHPSQELHGQEVLTRCKNCTLFAMHCQSRNHSQYINI